MSSVSNYRGVPHAAQQIGVILTAPRQKAVTGHLGPYGITPATPPAAATPGQSFQERYLQQGTPPP